MSATVRPSHQDGVIGDERLRWLYEYWESKKHGRRLPARGDIDPLEVPGILWPHVMLLDVLWSDAGPRFRYRRVGRVFWRALGREPTGRYIDEVLPETAGYRAYVVDIYCQVAATRRPMYSENVFMLDGQAVPMLTKRVSLPLSHDGGTVDMVLAGHVFDYQPFDPEYALSLVMDLKEVARIWLDG